MVNWDDTMILRLRELWDEGHSTAEIGRRMGISKCAVIGKAHRLDLPARPSPIKRDPNAPYKPSGRPRISPAPRTLPNLGAKGSSAPIQKAWTPRPTTCCWPIGEPGTKSFRFCDGTAVPGKPYCSDHAELAYVRKKVSIEQPKDVADRLEHGGGLAGDFRLGEPLGQAELYEVG